MGNLQHLLDSGQSTEEAFLMQMEVDEEYNPSSADDVAQAQFRYRLGQRMIKVELVSATHGQDRLDSGHAKRNHPRPTPENQVILGKVR